LNLRLTPSEIYQREFKRAFRGLDQEDVEDFLDQIAEDYEAITNENETMKQQLDALEEQLRQFDSTEAVNDLIQEAKEKITKETNKKLREAEIRAAEIISSAHAEAERIKENAEKILLEAEEKSNEGGLQTNNEAREATEIILKANEDANTIKQKAQDQANRLINEAQKKASEIISEAEEKAKSLNNNSKNVSEIIEKANQEAKRIIQEANLQADTITSKAKDQILDVQISEPVKLAPNSSSDLILNSIKLKAYAIIEKAKTEEMEAKREISRLKTQRERYLMGYRDLLSKQLRNLNDEADE